ncbi:tripartite ATP-independent periplasmic transporter solute receptor, DctP family [Acetomicrobium mobile DSM 13181]|uniref:Tripartite ATP-independent periplasmic transporter solute receptor, DctP family n=1 Tax=Acetomicrobium mobile (strain ATCC BAA-54 / DSM 13181 / JCM 12221 / NGA) TaxID=891968 RepID=I4BZB0_ACEMN|nr:DctP family TRAP transporter solute-binding subunit [Acetomicrobium mobile]AFM22617.1 tripartite ATP-independent periplasmic transporter solute receptor, DctP family [Acetomicrobium mobile DSM 13181]
MLRRVLVFALAVFMIFSFANCCGIIEIGCAKSASKKITLNFSHTMAPNSVSDMAAKEFKRLIEEKSNGAIKVNVVTNCGLSGGDLTKAIEMAMAGDIDIHACAPTNVANFDPRFFIFWMPFMFPTLDSLLNVCHSDEIYKEVDGWSAEKNLKLLGFHNAGARQISNNKKEIRKPSDLKGMNIRVPGAQIFIDLYRNCFGANPIAMDFSEVYTALQQGTIDGQENPVSVFYSSKFSEVQKYLTLWDYVRDTTAWFMSNKTLEKLTLDQRNMVMETAKQAIDWANNYVNDNEETILKQLRGEGVLITKLTPAEQKAFADAAAPIYSKYADIVGKDVISLFQRVAHSK